MKENTTRTLKHEFDFIHAKDSEKIVYHAVRRNDGKYHITWFLNGEHDDKIAKAKEIHELIDKGIWIEQ